MRCSFLTVAVVSLLLVALAPVCAVASVNRENLSPETVACGPKELPLQRLRSGSGNESRAWNMQSRYVGTVEPDLRSIEDLQRYAWRKDGRVRLIVGVDAPESQIRELRKYVIDLGGEAASAVRMGPATRALVVDVPIGSAYVFAEKLKINRFVKYIEPDLMVEACFAPNDEHWCRQWGPAKIQADVAWNTTVGSSNVLVAVVDTGIDYTHGDLAANYAPLGHDWINNDNDPIDDSGHGTHVAGIVAAVINNSIGIAGVAQVRIMAEKVLDESGRGSMGAVANGITHAADCGAKIISMSLGGAYENSVLHEAIEYAYNAGALLVVAAGNSGSNTPYYPAVYDEVIAVSATQQDDQLAEFSSYGEWVDLAAPGVEIYSTMPTYHVTLNDRGYSMNYDFLSGTSMACPHVSGVAGLAWSRFPNLTRDELRLALLLSADDLGDVGPDQFFGYGRVNARRAIEGLQEHDIAITGRRTPQRLDPGKTSKLNVTISNYGRHDETGVSVQLFTNGTLEDSAAVDFLGIYASASVQFLWNRTMSGSFNVTFLVVPVLGENYTENNVASAFVKVRFVATLTVPDDYLTIYGALKDAYDGDKVLVHEGYYPEGQIGLYRNNVTLVADGNATVDGWGAAYLFEIRGNHTIIEGFTIQNSSHGVFVASNGNEITKNTIKNTHDAFWLHQAFDCNISLNNIFNNGEGVWFEAGCHDVRIVENNFTGNEDFGILVVHSWNNTVHKNRIEGNGDLRSYMPFAYCGMCLLQSMDNTITENTFTDNARRGLWVDSDSMDNTIAGNTFNNDGIFFVDSHSNIVSNNTVNGKPLVYLKNTSDYVVNNAGQVILINCTNVQVENLDLSNTSTSIVLIGTNNSRIAHNVMANNGWSGATLENSHNNTLFRNNITANEERGIGIFSSSGNRIFENDIAKGRIGIDAWASSNNTVYHNNFISNLYQTFAPEVSPPSINAWDDGFPSGGNYWSNQLQGDSHRGVYQNETGSDGIVDEPYYMWPFVLGNKDRYPLTKLYGGPVDIGVTNVISPKTAVGQGYELNVSVKIVNYGLCPEAFNVTAYATIFQIGAFNNITLQSRSSVTLTFTWNTSDFPMSDYTLRAAATPVSGEQATTDNELNDGTVLVTIPGDTNGDHKVDLKDVYAVGKAYGSSIGDPKYVPNCDINDDGKIGLKDYYTACKNYGKSW